MNDARVLEFSNLQNIIRVLPTSTNILLYLYDIYLYMAALVAKTKITTKKPRQLLVLTLFMSSILYDIIYF